MSTSRPNIRSTFRTPDFGLLRALTAALLLLASAVSADAQLGFRAASMVAQKGQIIEVPIQVSNFDSIGGFQLSMTWDTNILDFKAITNFGLDKVENFDYSEITTGALFYYWYAENVDTGFSVEDDDTIFTLQFEVIGDQGDSTWVSFVDEPNAPEAVDYQDQVLPLEFTYGLVVVDDASSTIDLPASPIMMQVIPNPCREWCDVRLTVNESLDVTIQVVDLAGQIVYQQQRHMEPGQQEVSLPANQALAGGGYFIVVETDRGRYIKKMLVQK